MELRNTHLLPKSILLAALISFATLIPSASAIVADPVELVQIAPDVDLGSNWEIALERVVDPYTDRNGVVNFSFDLRNISGKDLELREMEFGYLASSGTTLLQQTAPPDQISDLLVRNDPASGAWSMSGKASLVGRPWDSFLSSWSDLESQGMRMIDIETYVDGGTRLYSGLFEPETYSPYALVGLPWNEFLSQWQEIESQGQRVIDIDRKSTRLNSSHRT